MPHPSDVEAAKQEADWLAHVYRPADPQLTVRAVVSGMGIGMVMCLSNLYMVLKTGWSAGVTLTACILAWGLFGGLTRLRLARSQLGLLENNAMGSVASAAGYMTGGGNMAALGALIMVTGLRPEAWVLVLWLASIAALGVFVAIPIKRQLINREQLPFPTGIATAETLRALYGDGDIAKRQSRRLTIAGLVGAAVAWFRDAKVMPFNLPSTFSLPINLAGRPLMDWTIGFEGSAMMAGVGGLMGFRVGWSLLLGAVLTYVVLGPQLVARGIVAEVGFKPITGWTVWLGASILVANGLTTFAFQWRSLVASVGSLLRLLRRKGAELVVDPLAAVEVPARWFAIGVALIAPVVVFLAWYAFDIPLWVGLLALPLSMVMGTIAARVTGETDVTPTKALGPVTQLIFAGLLPGQVVPNIMGANITGGIGLHAADLLTDLKAGYLLGARPRAQLIGQLFGVIAGAAVVVPVFNLLVPDAATLGSAEFPAPSSLVWANVTKMLVKGISALHPSAQWAALIGIVVGGGLGLIERAVPKARRAWVPSAMGIGIAMVLPAYNCVMMFLGALAAEVVQRRRGKVEGEALTTPIASGFIAGESLVGIGVKMLVAFGVMPK